MRNKTFASLLRGKRREGCIHGINNSKGRTNKRRFPAVFFLAIHHILVVSHRLWDSLSFLPVFDSIKFFYLDIYIYTEWISDFETNPFLIGIRIRSPSFIFSLFSNGRSLLSRASQASYIYGNTIMIEVNEALKRSRLFTSKSELSARCELCALR